MEEWSWFKFNNLELALGIALKFYTSLAKELQVKVRKFCGLIPKFVEVTAVMLDIFKVFDRVWDAGLLHKHSLMKFLVRHLA